MKKVVRVRISWEKHISQGGTLAKYPPLKENPGYCQFNNPNCYLLVDSTHLKNISQIGSFPQVGVNIKDI